MTARSKLRGQKGNLASAFCPFASAAPQPESTVSDAAAAGRRSLKFWRVTAALGGARPAGRGRLVWRRAAVTYYPLFFPSHFNFKLQENRAG